MQVTLSLFDHLFYAFCGLYLLVTVPKTFEWGVEDIVLALSSFIANAHDELYAYCTEKGSFLRKKLSQCNLPLLSTFSYFIYT